MELAFLLAPIFAFVLLRGIVDHRAKERAERRRAFEQALTDPRIDRATMQLLAQTLVGARPPRQGPSRGMAALLAIGWLTLFSGLGVLALGLIAGIREAPAAGALTALVGFGLVTYPFALRELEARHKAGQGAE